jgi:hypothetical protein
MATDEQSGQIRERHCIESARFLIAGAEIYMRGRVEIDCGCCGLVV